MNRCCENNFNESQRISLIVEDCVNIIFMTLMNESSTELDPCLKQNGGCSHRCTSVGDSVSCECNEGFSLDSDGKTCKSKFIYRFNIKINESPGYQKTVCQLLR